MHPAYPALLPASMRAGGMQSVEVSPYTFPGAKNLPKGRALPPPTGGATRVRVVRRPPAPGPAHVRASHAGHIADQIS